jgi:hypothetical protein
VHVHLVDATYELFRAHFSPRPPVLGRDGIVLSGVSGLVEQLLYLLREQGATHVGCATDRVIESFRNDLYPGYKTSAGMAPELLLQFPIAEQAIEALGLVLWPMVEFEADDAIAAAADRYAADPRVERIIICTPDKDMAQCVRDDRIVLWDRRREIVYDDAGVRAKWGVPPASIPDRLALVGDASMDTGPPGMGRQVPPLRSRNTARSGDPAQASSWEVQAWDAGHRARLNLAAHWDEAMLAGTLPGCAPGGRCRGPPDRRGGAPLGQRPQVEVGSVL